MKRKFLRTACASLLSLTILASASLSIGAYILDPSVEVVEESGSSNFWKRSDLRAYLNGTEKEGNTLPVDTTHDKRQESGYYESQFSDEEYALILPFEYLSTTYSDGHQTESVTIDRFWLPSAQPDNVVHLGHNDIDSEYFPEGTYSRRIPANYLATTPEGSSACWTRSPSYYGSDVRTSINGVNGTISYDSDREAYIAAAFKMDISSVSFAAMASASKIISSGGAIQCRFGGYQSEYGMYLKQSSNASFNATKVELRGNILNISYTGGADGQYIVVQAFKEDNLEGDNICYVAAAPHTGSSSVTIDASRWRLSSLEGYTVKVWMEDISNSASLAKATTPQTFGYEAHNLRVFADKSQLKPSWGTAADEENSAFENPTNQKIYFGNDKNGIPLQFWIAFRESYSSVSADGRYNGTIDNDGKIMTFYQAVAVEKAQFNNSTSEYETIKPAVTVSDFNISVIGDLIYNKNNHEVRVATLKT
ncbi:MAG: hypothetical protein J6U68_01425, partial [Clostridia bacterium]|nr:hypothetical protein [Clostridia bacterium]